MNKEILYKICIKNIVFFGIIKKNKNYYFVVGKI